MYESPTISLFFKKKMSNVRIHQMDYYQRVKNISIDYKKVKMLLLNSYSTAIVLAILERFYVQLYTLNNQPQPARDVQGKSPEGPLKVLTSGTSRRLSGDSQGTNTKIDELMKKLFFRCNSPCSKHLFLIFTEKTNIQKF